QFGVVRSCRANVGPGPAPESRQDYWSPPAWDTATGDRSPRRSASGILRTTRSVSARSTAPTRKLAADVDQAHEYRLWALRKAKSVVPITQPRVLGARVMPFALPPAVGQVRITAKLVSPGQPPAGVTATPMAAPAIAGWSASTITA